MPTISPPVRSPSIGGTGTLEAPPPAFLAAAKLLRARTLDSDWRREARPEQLPPEGEWFIWLVCAGRGWGKTWLGARWLAEQATATPGDYAVIGRSEQDTRETCIEGRSGLLPALGLHLGSPEYRRGTQQVRLSNGSVIYAYSAESPERTRGPNLSGVWCDELAAWRFLAQMWDETLIPAVRIGDPQIVVTTTPRPVPLLRELVSRDDGSVVVTRGSTFENAANLSGSALAELRRRYDGTRIGRQELLGELLDDVEGALWNRDLIDPYRVAAIDRGELSRVVVAVDPAVSASKTSDETGIIVAGIDRQGQGYLLDDLTCKLSPDGWARRVAHAYEKWGAGRVVAEVNQGGQLVETVLRTVNASLPITLVHASHGKQIRAEPIAAVYEQGKVHHVGAFPELEDELCTWIPGQAASPDRLDALVWAFTDLKPGRVLVSAPPILRRQSRWAPLREQANMGGAGIGAPPVAVPSCRSGIVSDTMQRNDKKRPRAEPTAGGRAKEVEAPMPTKKPTRAPERGHRVAQARKRAGLSQPQLAEKVGVSRPTIARIEAGGQAPSVTIALAIARALGEPVETLFGGGR